jgi:putative ABC transport system substrate-binding protein
MLRREFVTLVGGAAAWPFAVGAQPRTLPVVGVLSATAPASGGSLDGVGLFLRALAEMGYFDGKTISVETRWASGQYDRLPGLAAELVSRGPTVIFAEGNVNAARAAIGATASIPIVFANGGDPVKLGLVSSLNRPVGNVTGVSFFFSALGAKRLEVVRELRPAIARIGFLVNPDNAVTEIDVADMEGAARSIGLELIVVNAAKQDDFDAVFSKLSESRVDVLLVNNDTFFNSRRKDLISLAERYAIPTSYPSRSFATAGGLLSYGTDAVEMYRQAAVYVGRILKGAKPADLPVMLPVKFELVVNLKAANRLGLTIPPSLLARADEVIE